MNKHRNSTREEENEEKGEDMGFTLILGCKFHQNDNILLQQHSAQGLQIGLPS